MTLTVKLTVKEAGLTPHIAEKVNLTVSGNLQREVRIFSLRGAHLVAMFSRTAQTQIRFAVGQCSLGAILVAASERGLCAILMGDSPDELLNDLQRRFANAELSGGDHDFEQLVATVVGFVEAPQLGLKLPLDVRGTLFQQRVWQAPGDIPVGSTVSYSGLAQLIGAPKSARAVAQACAANALAVAIPCHRVVRNDGGLSGYRWGIERKRALLEREAQSLSLFSEG